MLQEPWTLPVLKTPRLILRPFTLEDAPEVQRLCGAREIASTTLSIPHPYEDGVAEKWIAGHAEAFAQKWDLALAITRSGEGRYVGGINLGIHLAHSRAEMGYVIGLPYWGKGYCTEAAKEMLRFAFEEMELHRVYAHHLTRNPASGKVMQKIGMKYEGTLRDHIKKWDVFEDIACYGIVRSH